VFLISKALLFLPEGFEETEALVPTDILRRAEVDVTTVSIGSGTLVTGSHAITVTADCAFDAVRDPMAYDMLILPGGPGHKRYPEHAALCELLRAFHAQGKHLAAICAAPTVLAGLGILDGKKAVCYPGMEKALGKAVYIDAPVVRDGHVTTAKWAGAAIAFGVALAEILAGAEKAAQVAQSFGAI